MEHIGARLWELMPQFHSIFIIARVYVVQLPINWVNEYLPQVIMSVGVCVVLHSLRVRDSDLI